MHLLRIDVDGEPAPPRKDRAVQRAARRVPHGGARRGPEEAFYSKWGASSKMRIRRRPQDVNAAGPGDLRGAAGEFVSGPKILTARDDPCQMRVWRIPEFPADPELALIDRDILAGAENRENGVVRHPRLHDCLGSRRRPSQSDGGPELLKRTLDGAEIRPVQRTVRIDDADEARAELPPSQKELSPDHEANPAGGGLAREDVPGGRGLPIHPRRPHGGEEPMEDLLDAPGAGSYPPQGNPPAPRADLGGGSGVPADAALDRATLFIVGQSDVAARAAHRVPALLA